MGKERTKEFYNEKTDLAFKTYELSPWKQLYDKVVEFMPSNKNYSILDLGCGSGRLCKALALNGYLKYLGVDFAEKLILEARKYNKSDNFLVEDVFNHTFQETFKDYDIFIISEVLEHLNDDLNLVKSLPSGKYLIYSVPNFNSAGHVRWFGSMESVLDRYSGLIIPDCYETITYKHNKRLKAFIVRGRIV